MRQPTTRHYTSHLITLITMAPFRPKEAPGPERQLMIKTKACQRYVETFVLSLFDFDSIECEMCACTRILTFSLSLSQTANLISFMVFIIIIAIIILIDKTDSQKKWPTTKRKHWKMNKPWKE